MAFLRTAIAASTALPAALVFSSLPSSYANSSSSSQSPKTLSFLSLKPLLTSHNLRLPRNLTIPPFALHMDSPKLSVQDDDLLTDLLTEFMVDMNCEGCVSAVKNKLQTVNGVKNVEVDLSNQVVRVLGSSTVKTMIEALEQTGRKVRLIGQGVPEDFLVSAAVSEFKGPEIFGVVRLAQVNMKLAKIEASFSGLSPGKHGWAIHEYGDLTKGPASTGKVFSPTEAKEPLGDLGTLDANEKGDAFFIGVKHMLRVPDLIGRAVVVYSTKDKSDQGLAAAVIARSASVGENYKKVCLCDGTTIWEASDSDFVSSKV